MDENRKKSELSGNSSAETSNGTRGKQGSRSRNEASRPRRATLPVEVPKKCYLLRELTAKRMAIEKGMLDVDQLVLKLITSGNLDFITLNEITKYPVKEDRTRILLDHFSKINDNGILRQFVSFMRDPLILNSEALQWAEYMQGCSDSCCMFFIKRYSNVFKYALEEQGIESFAEYFEESGVLNSSEIEELCKYSFKEAAEQFMHILFTKTTILTVANMWFVLVEFRHEIPYLGPYIDSFLDAFDEQTGFFSPRFDPLLPVEPLLVGKCYVNLYRLLHIIHVEGTEAVRSIFDRHITSAELEEEVRKNKVLIKNRLEGKDFSSFSKIWLNIIYSTEKFKTVHFTLPLFQFLAVFMKKFPRPKKGWTGRLAKSDTSSGAYLRRICEMRDSLLKDIFFTDVFYSKFDKLWNEITQILVQLGVSDKRLQELKTQPMSAVFMDRKYMEKYFNKPLSQLLEELIVRHHKGISSVCACSLEENLPSEQPKKLEAKVADITKAKVADIKEQNTKAKVADIKEQNTKAKVADIKEQNTKAKVADIKEQNTKAKVADIKEQNTKAKKEQKEKDTSEDESEPLTTAENTKSKKRRKRARGKKGKKTEAAAPTLTKEAETLGELKCLSPQSSEVPLEQQVMTQKSPATETGKDLKSEQDSLSNTSHLETDQSVPVASQAVSTSPTEPEYCENRHEKPEIEVETSHTKILDRLIDACVNTDPVDFKESFKRLEVERNALMQNIENLNDRCKQTENKSHLEIKAWKQRIREKERQCQSLQQEFVSLNQQLKEEFRRMAQEQEDHQTQLLKVKDQICGKKSELERCIKSNIDKDKEIMKVKRELQQERERWLREKLQLEEELANIQQTELETLRKAINQEVFLLEMHRDFFVCNLESALVETEQQLTNLKDHIKGQTVVPPLIQGALNKWEGVATDLRNKIDYTTKEFNNHIYMIKNGAKLQSLPPLNNPEQPYPLSLHVMKSGNQANVLHSLGSQPSLQAYTGSPIPVMPSSLRGYNNRLELNSFIDQVQTGQELWTGFGKQKSSETRVQLQSTEEDPCVICHEELVPSEDCYMLECKHVFHRKCIDHWLKEQSTCPICRILVLKPEDYPQLSKN
uniref:E3 ubiquitin-protein ligase DZIP3-like n=1 Tax=Callorhinchus milii TaxID=7868 RepID=A0A4W3K7C0_CALMI